MQLQYLYFVCKVAEKLKEESVDQSLQAGVSKAYAARREEIKHALVQEVNCQNYVKIGIALIPNFQLNQATKTSSRFLTDFDWSLRVIISKYLFRNLFFHLSFWVDGHVQRQIVHC
jgi:hypothetical protein